MKKIVSIILAIAIVFSSTTMLASAAEEPQSLPTGFVVTKGTVSYEPTVGPDVTTRAVSVPTQFAPSSWYDVYHYWTAKYYTYSSYIFDPAYHSNYKWQYFHADTNGQHFYVQVYDQNGNFEFEITCGADYELEFGSDVKLAKPYYVVIYNNNPENGSISSGARYKLYGTY